MNSFFSRYGTFLAIPPLLVMVIIIAINFHVSTQTAVTLVRIDENTVVAYLPKEAEVPSTLVITSPELGEIALEVSSGCNESSEQRVTCRGALPTTDTHITGYIKSEPIPIYRVLFKRI